MPQWVGDNELGMFSVAFERTRGRAVDLDHPWTDALGGVTPVE